LKKVNQNIMTLELYALENNFYLAKFIEKESHVQENINDCEVILVVDISGSMYCYSDLYTSYIPNFMKSIGYNLNKKCHMLLFGSDLYFAYDTVSILNRINPCGSTAAELPAQYLLVSKILDNKKKYKMFFFTDGAFNNQITATNSWQVVEQYITNNKIQCDTYAFRIDHQAEVIGLVPFLNINKTQDSNIHLYDVSKKELHLQNFPNLGFKSKFTLSFGPKNNICSNYPLQPLQNTIVVSNDAIFLLHTNDLDILNQEHNVNQVLQIKTPTISMLCGYVSMWIKKLSLEKILNDKLDISQIIQWVQCTQKYIETNNNASSSTSYKYLKHLRDRSSEIGHVIERLRMLNSSAKIKTLNTQQQATYLRDVINTKLGRSISKRTMKYDVNKDIAVAIRDEFKNLKNVIHELDSVDDSRHQSSFISLETTLGALRSIAQDLTDEEIDHMKLEDLVSLLHIVGLGVNAPVGDYPDPMVYHMEKVTFIFVSLADILHAEMNGQDLYAPGIDVKLNNVIPVFEDPILFKFCYKYLRNSMEILSGIGMRRLLAYIPQTSKYTALIGLWSIIAEEPQAWSYNLIRTMLPQLQIMFDGWFDYVVHDLIEPGTLNNNMTRQVYIGNNGITNMILPIYQLLSDGSEQCVMKRKLLPAIYRALYSFELAVVARKTQRYSVQQDKEFDYFDKCLITDLVHSLEWTFNTIYLDKLLTQRKFLKNLFTLEIALSKTFEEFKSFKLTDEYIQSRLEIDYSFIEFQYVTLIQAFIHKNKSERCEGLSIDNPLYNVLKKKERSLVADLRTHNSAIFYIADIVDIKYKKIQYAIFMKQFMAELIYTRNLYAQLLARLPYEEFLIAYSNGFKVQDKVFHINTLDENFTTSFAQMCSTEHSIDMNKKCLFFIKGGEKNNIFNSGKMARFLIGKSRKFISDVEYQILRDDIKIYVYRNAPNRHSHSNEKQSFFAYGFQSFEEYETSVSNAELMEYLSVHTNCCTPFSHSKRSHGN
jgi:flagellar biosynthesis/type III secretory pathway chaperone